MPRGALSSIEKSSRSSRRSELDLEDAREVAVLRIVVAVEAVDHRSDLRVVALVARPRLEVAADERERRAYAAVSRDARQQSPRDLILDGELPELHETARFDEPVL